MNKMISGAGGAIYLRKGNISFTSPIGVFRE